MIQIDTDLSLEKLHSLKTDMKPKHVPLEFQETRIYIEIIIKSSVVFFFLGGGRIGFD